MAECDDPGFALLRLLAEHGPMSPARACKRLGLQRSQLQRILLELASEDDGGGLGLIELHTEGDRQRLQLSARGRELCACE